MPNYLLIVSMVLFFAGILCALCSCFMLYRNDKVYKFRVDMIAADFERYKKLPGYGEMLYKFWIPLDKF